MTAATDPTVTVYDVETDTTLYKIPSREALRYLAMYRESGDTQYDYDTTDKDGNPVRVVLTVNAPVPGFTTDQGAVYVFPRTTDTPTATEPADDASIPPDNQYADALATYKDKGAAHAPDHALMAAFCEYNLQIVVGAVSPQLVWEGAMKKGLNAKDLLALANTSVMAVSDLQWV